VAGPGERNADKAGAGRPDLTRPGWASGATSGESSAPSQCGCNRWRMATRWARARDSPTPTRSRGSAGAPPDYVGHRLTAGAVCAVALRHRAHGGGALSAGLDRARARAASVRFRQVDALGGARGSRARWTSCRRRRRALGHGRPPAAACEPQLVRPHPHRGQRIGVVLLTPRFATSRLPCGPVVDPRRVNQARGAEPAPAMRLGTRRLDDRTTEWTAARHVPTTARNRIPLRNRDSSGWIRTIDLTIMSRAPPCERRTHPGTSRRVIPAKQGFRRSSPLTGVPARVRAGGPVVDPREGWR
jgi:hypothetical protein